MQTAVFKESAIQLPSSAGVQGATVEDLPKDLYVPPEALQVFLEAFEGPLDLLLYLIQRQNVDIFDIPIAEITYQYVQYVELMKELHLDLAAEYLVMAATLMEIKSRLLLPTHEETEDLQQDPRAKLAQQLQDYARYKQAAEDLVKLPQLGKDFFAAKAEPPDLPREIIVPKIPLDAMLLAMKEVMARASLFASHQITKEPLSVRERMTLVLAALKKNKRVDFVSLFSVEEGRAGVVVTLLAILELAKELLVEIVQIDVFGKIEVLNVDTEKEKSHV